MLLFRKETMLHQSVSSAHVVGFVEAFDHLNWPVLVLECCHLGNAAGLLTADTCDGSTHLNEKLVSQVMVQMLLALRDLHGATLPSS